LEKINAGERSVPRAFRIFFSLVFVCGLSGCARGKGEVTLVNKTGKAVIQGELKIGDQIFPLSRMERGESLCFSFRNPSRGAHAYQISLTLSDRRQMVDSIGSVRRGMDYRDTLVVEKRALTLDSAQNTPGDMNHLSKGSQSKKLKWVLLK
jgi:hypothetical protein